MKKIIGYTAVVFAFCSTAFAQVTKVGNDTLLDVAGWNIEWFGDLTNGPSDEALQFNNVKSVLKNTDIDIWGLAEVSNPTLFASLLTDLTVYDFVLSNFSQTQKTGLIWKKSKFDLVSSASVLTEYSYDFASRAPLEVALKSKDNNITDTLYFYVLHFKANTGSQTEKVTSYNRRKNAAGYLKTYLDANRKYKKVIVLGDWNDDLDESIVYENGAYLTSPFSNFLTDSARYFFTSLQLTKTGQQSTASYPNMIDHQMISAYMRDSFYVANSSRVMTQTAAQISNYRNNTSDHYPVLGRFNMKRYFKAEPPNTGVDEWNVFDDVLVYPNPASQYLMVDTKQFIKQLVLTDAVGNRLITSYETHIDISGIANGLYFLTIVGDEGKAVKKVFIEH
jgi:exonuclease III